MPLQIPNKLYFKIGEVARITKVKPHVLRYWESEFNIITPDKSNGNHRVYRKRDVEFILFIKRLLHKEKYTLQGAKRKVRGFKAGGEGESAMPLTDVKYKKALKDLKGELITIQKLLD